MDPAESTRIMPQATTKTIKHTAKAAGKHFLSRMIDDWKRPLAAAQGLLYAVKHTCM